MFTWLKSLLGRAYQLNADDIVVFVVGPSGGGKSWFILEVTKSPLITPSRTLQPSTTSPVAIRCGLTDEAKIALGASTENNIVFVDTPSFQTFMEGKNKAEKETERWLKESKPKCTRAGIVYVDRVETNPMNGSVQSHLNAFASTFPKGFKCLPTRLRAVLSYESTLSESKIRDHRQKFQSQLVTLKSSFTKGQMLAWDATFHSELFVKGNQSDETAWEAVKQLFTHGST